MDPSFSKAPPRAFVRFGTAAVLTALLMTPRTAGAQVSSVAEVIDGHGSAVVRNGSGSLVRVDVALWESDETSRPLRLLKEARANLWPVSFELAPGESQVVRISIGRDAYPDGTLLRLETRLVPAPPMPAEEGESQRAVQVILTTRMLSKVCVRLAATHHARSDRP
ncbi:MAG TPA: hypothetical protein VK837_06725 [Longimicrobiales bacterium]|nr:hypothetical protein [Longimicrobiales bacterium]